MKSVEGEAYERGKVTLQGKIRGREGGRGVGEERTKRKNKRKEKCEGKGKWVKIKVKVNVERFQGRTSEREIVESFLYFPTAIFVVEEARSFSSELERDV